MDTHTMRSTSIVQMYGPTIALLYMLWKLDVVGMRKISHSYGVVMAKTHNYQEPPWSIRLATVSLSLEYLQFCKREEGEEELRYVNQQNR